MLDWSFMLDGKESIHKVKAAVLVNDPEALVEAGVAGLGLFQALDIGVQRHVASGALRLVLPHVPTATGPISVLLPSRKHVPPPVKAFVDWVSRLMSGSSAA